MLLIPAGRVKAAACLFLFALAEAAAAQSPKPVQVQMRNVSLHVDAQIVLQVRRLRGELISTSPAPPVFDDKHSFEVRIDSAEIAVSARHLSQLLNRYVFAYKGSPLRRLVVTTEQARLKIQGTVQKGVDIPFTIIATAQVDAQSQLRLHATSIKALGVPAKGLLSFFGVELENLVKLKEGHGVRVDGDDFVLNPSGLVPPPRIDGRLQAVRVEPGTIVQVFGPGHLAPLRPPDRAARNYMYFSGGVLRFGKLTMTDTDLQLIDANPEDPFDFFEDKYNEQLVAGYSKSTPAHGLKVFMPDYHRLAGRAALASKARSTPNSR